MADRTVSVDGVGYASNDLVGGDNIIVYVGPAKYTPGEGQNLTYPAPAEDDTLPTQYKLVGVIQQLSVQSGRQQRQINEIGSNAKYLVSSRGQKQMTISRIVTTTGSVLYSLYRFATMSEGKVGPSGNIWMTMSHPIFRKPIGLIFVVGYYDDNNEWNAKEIKYHEDVVISSVGTQITEGDVGVADNLSLVWSNTITIPTSGGNTNG